MLRHCGATAELWFESLRDYSLFLVTLSSCTSNRILCISFVDLCLGKNGSTEVTCCLGQRIAPPYKECCLVEFVYLSASEGLSDLVSPMPTITIIVYPRWASSHGHSTGTGDVRSTLAAYCVFSQSFSGSNFWTPRLLVPVLPLEVSCGDGSLPYSEPGYLNVC